MRNENKQTSAEDDQRKTALAEVCALLSARKYCLRLADMHPSYQRLVDAAARLRGIFGESNLSEALHSPDVQKVNNWQRRGVSRDGAIEAERYLGIPAIWVIDGKLPQTDGWSKLAAPAVEMPLAPYERSDIRELVDIAAQMDHISLRALITLLKKLHPPRER